MGHFTKRINAEEWDATANRKKKNENRKNNLTKNHHNKSYICQVYFWSNTWNNILTELTRHWFSDYFNIKKIWETYFSGKRRTRVCHIVISSTANAVPKVKHIRILSQALLKCLHKSLPHIHSSYNCITKSPTPHQQEKAALTLSRSSVQSGSIKRYWQN